MAMSFTPNGQTWQPSSFGGVSLAWHTSGAWMVVAGKKIISDGTLPMGRLANAELRSAKQAAHAAFDPIWKSGFLSRRAAYTWLADVLGIPFDQCHIGEFDLQRCRQVVGISRTAGQPA